MDFTENLLRPTWIEIDLDAVSHNVREIKRFIGEKVNLIPVLKGNAYGCGLTEVVQTLSREAIYGFGVGNIYEAIEVRKNSSLPILLFGNTLPNAIPEIQRHRIIPSVSDWDWIETFSRTAQAPMPVFVKIDTGSNRLGVPYGEAFGFIQKASDLKNIEIAGIQTHVGGNREFAHKAFDQFRKIIDQLEHSGFDIPMKLAAHSQWIAQLPNSWLNAADPGKMIYGIVPFELPDPLRVKPAFTKLASKIIHLKKSIDISPERFDLIGVIPIGMADGLPSAYTPGAEVLVRGKKVPIIKIHAEHTRIDVSEIPEVRIGDEVVLIGRQGNEIIDFYSVAAKCRTTESELLRGLSRCVPKIYRMNGVQSRISQSV